MKAACGHVFKYGDNVDTDVIIPARYLNSSDPKELATHCMEDIDKDFVKNVKEGDIIVANKNFGCGSSREHAPIAIKAAKFAVNNGIMLDLAAGVALEGEACGAPFCSEDRVEGMKAFIEKREAKFNNR